MRTIHTALAVTSAVVALAAGLACGGAATSDPITLPTISASAAPTTPPAAEEESLSPAKKEVLNAATAALSYLDGQSFSRAGLIKQLKYEGYSTKAATQAVDALKVDWNAQAVLTAKNYLDGQAFSRKGLIAQLKYEGFTTAQAAHGVDGAGL